MPFRDLVKLSFFLFVFSFSCKYSSSKSATANSAGTVLKNNIIEVWNFKIKSNSQEITNKLDATFGSVNGFALDVQKNNNSVTFKVRKRILYAFQTLLRNHIIANGEIKRIENETEVKISFSQHF